MKSGNSFIAANYPLTRSSYRRWTVTAEGEKRAKEIEATTDKLKAEIDAAMAGRVEAWA